MYTFMDWTTVIQSKEEKDVYSLDILPFVFLVISYDSPNYHIPTKEKDID